MNDYIQHTKPALRSRFFFIRLLTSRRALKWFGLISIVFLLASYIAFHVWVEHFYYTKVMARYGHRPGTTWERGEKESIKKKLSAFKHFLDSPVCFPEECYKTPVRSETLLAKINGLERIEADLQKDRSWTCYSICQQWFECFLSSKQLTKADWEEFGNDLVKIDAFLQAGLKIAEQMRRELNANESPSNTPYLPKPFPLSTFVLGQKLKAISLAHSNRHQEAAECLMEAFWVLIPDPYRDFGKYSDVKHDICDGAFSLASLFESEIPYIQDDQFLEKCLDDLNRIEPYFFQDISEFVRELSLWSKLQEIQNRGLGTIDLSSGKNGQYYARQLIRYENEYFTASESLSKLWNDWLTGYKRSSWDWERIVEGFSPWLVYPHYADLYALLNSFNFRNRENYLWNENRTRSKFDLLRLKIAAELFYRETGKYPTQTAELVPKYFTEEPINRETGTPYVWLSGVPDVD